MVGPPPESKGRPDRLFQSKEVFENPDVRAVAEAMQVLECSRLLMRSPGEHAHVGLTRLGIHALQTHTVRQHLGLGESPPPTA